MCSSRELSGLAVFQLAKTFDALPLTRRFIMTSADLHRREAEYLVDTPLVRARRLVFACLSR